MNYETILDVMCFSVYFMLSTYAIFKYSRRD